MVHVAGRRWSIDRAFSLLVRFPGFRRSFDATASRGRERWKREGNPKRIRWNHSAPRTLTCAKKTIPIVSLGAGIYIRGLPLFAMVHRREMIRRPVLPWRGPGSSRGSLRYRFERRTVKREFLRRATCSVARSGFLLATAPRARGTNKYLYGPCEIRAPTAVALAVERRAFFSAPRPGPIGSLSFNLDAYKKEFSYIPWRKRDVSAKE